MKKLNENPTKRLGVAWDRAYFSVQEMENCEEVSFDGYKVFAPQNPHGILTRGFGDYMKLPPEEERVLKHGLECYVEDGVDF